LASEKYVKFHISSLDQKSRGSKVERNEDLHLLRAKSARSVMMTNNNMKSQLP
jgi:hypothetical protein